MALVRSLRLGTLFPNVVEGDGAMRATYSRWSCVGVTFCCLTLTAFTGCKSGFKAPSADWLSWGKPKPTASSLASVPKRPSVGALPTPSATTAGAASTYGQQSYARNTSGPSGYGANGTTGYQTGPYSTGAAGAYPGTSSGIAGTPTATSPYRSPYQAAQGTTSGYDTGAKYGVADARGSANYQVGSTSAANNTQPWNSDAYRRAGDPYGGTQAAGSGGQSTGAEPSISYPQTQSPQTQNSYNSGNYGASATGQYHQPASYQQTPQGETATASRAYASDAGQAAYPSTTPGNYESSSTGGYRPGSTSRDTGALSTPTSTSSAAAGSYPTTGGAASTTANQSWSYGTAGQYPTTGQY